MSSDGGNAYDKNQGIDPTAPQREAADIIAQEDDDTVPLLLAGLAGMLLFFAFGLGLAAAVAEPGLWIVSLILVLVASVMLFARHVMVRRRKKELAQALVKARCHYCGGQNRPHAHRCHFCGAPLW